MTNLKPGMGDPCAGQSIARLVDSVSENLEKSDFWENFGLAPPIGSEIGILSFIVFN